MMADLSIDRRSNPAAFTNDQWEDEDDDDDDVEDSEIIDRSE